MVHSRAFGLGAAALAAAGTAALAGCVLVRPATLASLPSPAEFKGGLALRAAGLASVRAQVRAEIRGPSGRRRSAQMILAQAPNRIRIDVMSPFGPTHSLASDGTSLAVYDRAEAVVYRGIASAANIARFTGVPLEIPLLASLVRGMPPDLGGRWPGRVGTEGRFWSWTRVLPGGGDLVLLFDRGSLLVRKLRVLGDRRVPDLTVLFEDYRNAEGLRFPYRIEATVEGRGGVELVYERVWRGIVPGDNAFKIRAGPGVGSMDMERMDAGPGLP